MQQAHVKLVLCVGHMWQRHCLSRSLCSSCLPLSCYNMYTYAP